MCHTSAKHFLIPVTIGTFGLLLAGFSSFAQNSNRENAPYSRYGLGEERNGANTALKGMGTIQSAYANGFNVNTENPASYSALKLVTYEAGAEGSMRTIISKNQSFGTGSATLSYLTIGIPVGKHAGMALGLKPVTRVYYNMSDSTELAGIGPAVRGYYGDGNTSYAFIGASGTLKGFSIGANFGYMFGTIRNTSLVQKQYDTVNAYNTDFSRFTKIGGVYYELGLQYEAKLKKDLALRLGGTVALSQQLNAAQDEYQVIWRRSSGAAVYDTAVFTNNVKDKITLPLTYSFGAHVLGGEQWTAGVDFSASQWSQYRGYGGQPDSVDNSYRIAVGGEYTPDPGDIYNYLQRVTYRLGFYYGKDLIRLRNTDINYYAVTAGASLPFRRSADRIHLALELGRRGTETNGLIQENFVRFSLGISLNDKWFIKRKYD